MRIIITGGHLTPALAVIEELRKKEKDLDLLFVGRKHPLEGDSTVSAEYKIITQMGIPFVSLVTGRLQRKFTRYTIPSLLKIPIGFLQTLWWIRKFRSDVILSFGGYVAVPVVVAGWLLRVPVVTHEQTVVSGLANRIIGFFAQKICVSWPESMGYFPKEKVVLTGNPVRKEIFQITQSPNILISQSPNIPIIYVTGGSVGSHAINTAVSECLPQLLEKYIVIHQCGDSEKYQDFEKLKVKSGALRLRSPRPELGTKAGQELKVDLQKRYFLTKYVGPQDIGWVLSRADLVVSRAGANTVTELAALGKPAILIPLPWAQADEQFQNAQILAQVGAAVILPQEKLTGEELKEQIDKMIQNFNHYKKAAQKTKEIIDLSAAQKITAVVSEVYGERRKS